MKTIEESKSGMFWHIHHDVLCEYSANIDERIAYIKKEKPQHEIETRLRLLRPVKGELPSEFVTARKAWDKACKARDKARDKGDKHKDTIEVLHKLECPNCPWNGSTIFP